ncbi:PaREP1 family protein [Vulcanisaeta sp. JCM 16161]|uniref:PaREP1 family protein n=1 Tax=Vulcanisaeta sp. JCM 16161 TaxID=1295372 RepID=UPI00406CF1D8
MSTVSIEIPKTLYEEATRSGIDIEELILTAIIKTLRLDPETTMKARLELAMKYLDEGEALIDRDPAQASEKLYRAAEEVVKALAQYYDLKDVLSRVEGRGRWTVTDLEKAVLAISRTLGDRVRHSWDTANYLHVWGFHETKLDPEDVRERVPDIEKMVQEAQKILTKQGK